jgi:hypothetical protein
MKARRRCRQQSAASAELSAAVPLCTIEGAGAKATKSERPQAATNEKITDKEMRVSPEGVNEEDGLIARCESKAIMYP